MHSFCHILFMTISALQAKKETDRKTAIKLLKEGWTQTKIAKFLNVDQSTISRWNKWYRAKGYDGLKPAVHSGRPPLLSLTQKEELKDFIDDGAEQCGFIGNFWTQKRVSRLVKEKFSIEITPRHCGNILRDLGYVLKIPQTKSYEQNLEKVEEWKTEKIPEIKKKL